MMRYIDQVYGGGVLTFSAALLNEYLTEDLTSKTFFSSSERFWSRFCDDGQYYGNELCEEQRHRHYHHHHHQQQLLPKAMAKKIPHFTSRESIRRDPSVKSSLPVSSE